MLVTRNVWGVKYRRMNGKEAIAYIAVDTLEEAIESVKSDIVCECVTSVVFVTDGEGVPVKVHIPAEFVGLPEYTEHKKREKP